MVGSSTHVSNQFLRMTFSASAYRVDKLIADLGLEEFAVLLAPPIQNAHYYFYNVKDFASLSHKHFSVRDQQCQNEIQFAMSDQSKFLERVTRKGISEEPEYRRRSSHCSS